MDLEIRNALRSLEQAIRGAKGPVFTDADYGLALRALVRVCHAMDAQDHSFRAMAAEAESIERERERESGRRDLLEGINELFETLEDGSDD